MGFSTAIVWFRRDLRCHDHPALAAAVREYDRIVPLFVFDDVLLRGRFASAPRTAFMLGCLRDLDAALAERGAGLCVRTGRPEHELPAVAASAGAAAVLWTSDVSPYARARDRRVTEALRGAGVRARPQQGGYCADVSVPRTQDGRPFSVFTPFRRAQQRVERRPVQRAPVRLALPAALDPGRLPGPWALGLADATELPEPFCAPGERAGRAAMARWLDGPIDRYGEGRDVLDGTTSGLSPYLRWGCISARELEERAWRRGGAGASAFVRQLAWRDFYAHVLLSHPGNAHAELQPRLRNLEWDADDGLLQAWQQGRTGYPLVDASMRQLARTGWMPNRARLVAGSFLTKDLHLDWRAGEAWFERLLLDGEPAQNNGNWQWVASTGVDPAPCSRRIFNPVLQQRRHDADGRYVRRWVPELREVPDRRLAEPWTMSDAEQRAARCVIGSDYPGPVVDHARERRAAIERYAAATR
jgi:deoxyribodipyrimidine photo-lyase